MNAKISLRLGSLYYANEKRRNELLALLKEYRDTVEEVVFFTGPGFFPPCLSFVDRQAAQVREAIPLFRKLGLPVGLDQHTTLLTMYEAPGQSLNEPWQRMQDISGKTCLTYCASDRRMQAFVRELYVRLAQTGPDFIWIDDDVRLSYPYLIQYGCYCGLCLENFAQETGKNWTRESLRAALNGGALEERLAVRKQWLAHNRRYFEKLYTLIRSAVDSVNPAIQLGCMSGHSAYDGNGQQEITAALAGRDKLPVKWRPGGGFYTDDQPAEVLDKAHMIGGIVARLPESVTDIQSENEHFPCQVLQKSTTILAVEVGAYIAAGSTGCALNFLGTGDPLGEDRPKFARVRSHRKFYDRLVGAFGRSPCEGLWLARTKDNFASQFLEGNWPEGCGETYRNDGDIVKELTQIGLPIAYGQSGASVTILPGNTCVEFSRDELLNILSGGVLLDGAALTCLNGMGMAEHTGFTVRETTNKEDGVEILTADPLNGSFAGWRRYYFPSWFRTQNVHLLSPATPRSRVLAQNIGITAINTDTVAKSKDFGATGGVFENSLGGRVAVLGCYPWHMLLSLAKSSQYKALMRWLSGERLPAYIGSLHKVALWCRRDAQGRPAIFLVNTSLDAAENVQIMLCGTSDAMTLLRADGVTTERLSRTKQDGPYGQFEIGRIMPWEMVMVIQTMEAVK
jgi:hypothetical protein